MNRAIIVLTCLFAPVVATAQSRPEQGARVRVTSPRHDLRKDIMHVAEVRGDSLVLESQTFNGSVAVSDITSLEVNVGVRMNFQRDALIGLALGGLIGAAIGAGAHDACSGEEPCIIPASRTTAAASGAAAFGAAGLVVGGIFGLFDITEDWARLPMPARASIGPSRKGGISLSLSMAF